jgi:peptidyl-prolyl cis-trans isomerase SurA
MALPQFVHCSLRTAVCCILLFGAPALISTSASAQAVVGSINDDPITNVDIDQHMKILRVLHKPATHEASLEDIYQTRLKLIETSKYKINVTDSDIGSAIGSTAREMKVQPQQLLVSLQHAGVTEDQWKQRWKADAAWQLYIRALNRTLEVPEEEVRAELAKDNKTRSTEYTLRQVTLVVPNNGNAAARMQDAQALRSRFTDCTTGVQLVTAFHDAVIREPVTRSASALSDQLRQTLDKTDVGHLTAPQRSPQGIEMLAVCGKANRLDSAAADEMRNDMLTKKLRSESDRRYQEVRAKAIIVTK